MTAQFANKKVFFFLNVHAYDHCFLSMPVQSVKVSSVNKLKFIFSFDKNSMPCAYSVG